MDLFYKMSDFDLFVRFYVDSFKPTIPMIISEINNSLSGSFDSLKNIIPIKTLPTAPIPAQTA